MQRNSISGRLETTTPYIGDLIQSIDKGEIKVPKFQRPYVWKDEQAKQLLDSITNSYPVGSFLFWRTKSRMVAERNVGDFVLPDTDDMSPTDYVLDGQQRITVIYSTFSNNTNITSFYVYYNLETQDFVISKTEKQSPILFPLRHIYDTPKLLDFRTSLIDHDNEYKDFQHRLDALVKSINDYKFPVVTLKDLELEQVCPIFERINSSGTTLSVYDLMVAATYSSDFDLEVHVQRVSQSLESKGFSDIARPTVLKVISAIAFGSIKELSLKSLRDKSEPELEALISLTESSLQHSVDLLTTEFRVHSWEFLSYEALIIIISYLYSRQRHMTPDQITRLRQWFWRSSFSERYKIGGENFVSRDLEKVEAWVFTGTGTADDFGQPISAKDFRESLFRSNYSRSRAFILMLARQNPLDIGTGATIDVEEALSSFNKKQFHHIFPKDFVKKSIENEEPNVLANVCMTSAKTNNWIRAKDPNSYFPELLTSLALLADDVFESNLLPVPSKFDYSAATFSEFLTARSEILEFECRRLCM